ncbi:LPS-assembly protein LptD [Marinobacter fonticola]|uniref:LPS-assembly protein LptD n=1 Tax=Marinobacter fonticola TaxID=2603215 RepID=UPI001D0DB6F4|nr:LPS-assembly protein LptD [Marinobacter fonticola]
MLASTLFAPQVGAQSAAEIDWRPRSELPPEQQAELPAYCEGGYLQPELGSAQSPLFDSNSSGNAHMPIEASGLNARYEVDSQLTLEGDVHLRQGTFSAQGSRAQYDQATGQMALSGPIVSRGEGFLLTGESAEYDANSGELEMNTATFLIHAAEMRGQAGFLSRPTESLVNIEQGRLTTCSPESNAWAIVASDIELDRAEGFGTATHVRLEVKDVPVFYWPYATFPIDDRRKTGFLYPSFGTSNTGSGMFISTPYYLNLAPHYDVTLTPQYIHGRGLFNEVEGRYLSEYGESVLQLGYIRDDRHYADEFPGEDGERWGLDFTSQLNFGYNWTGYADYSTVSDDDYLSDLNRTLEINQVTHLQRRGGIRYDSRHQYFEAYLSGYQTLSDTIADSQKPYSQLPEIIYGADYQWSVVETLLATQYTYFHRDNDTLTGLSRANGHRFRAAPELALDFRALWGYSRPSVTLDYTQYQLEDYTAREDDTFSRTVPIYEWDNGLYFDRRDSMFGIPYNQTLEPRLYYAYSDYEDQSDIPDFDTALKDFSFDQLFSPNRFSGGDRVSDNNRLTAAVTTRFNDLNTGIERARLSIGQVYYYDERQVSLNGVGADDRSDSPLAGEAVFRPLETLDIRTSGLWDPRSKQTEEGRSQLVFHSPDYRYLATLGHTYDRDDFEQMDIGAVFPVTDRVSLIGRWLYDSEADRTAGSLAGIEYTDCCWSLQLVSQNYLTDDRELENRILFQIQLKGLGGSGDSSGRVSEAIYGFDERDDRRFGRTNMRY